MLIIIGLIALAIVSLLGVFFLLREDEAVAQPVETSIPAIQEVAETNLAITAPDQVEEMQPEQGAKESDEMGSWSYAELAQQISFLQQRQQETQTELLLLNEVVEKLRLAVEDMSLSGLSHN